MSRKRKLQALNFTCTKCNIHTSGGLYKQNFDLDFCEDCATQDKNNLKLNLLPITTVIEKYKLSKNILEAEKIKFLTKDNPHDKKFKPMKLYCEYQVEKFAVKMYGQEKVEARVKKFDQKLKKMEEKTVKNLEIDQEKTDEAYDDLLALIGGPGPEKVAKK